MSNQVVGLKPKKQSLSNEAFKELLNTTVASSSDALSEGAAVGKVFGGGKRPRLSAPVSQQASEEAISRKRAKREAYEKKKLLNQAAKNQYRDRAAERRLGINPDYVDDVVLLTGGAVSAEAATQAAAAQAKAAAATPMLSPFHGDAVAGVAAAGTTPGASAPGVSVGPEEDQLKQIMLGHDVATRTLTAEETQYLGGDVKHTHLVKGLDYSLLEQTRIQVAKEEEEREKREQSRQKTAGAKLVLPTDSAGQSGPGVDESQAHTAMGRALAAVLFKEPPARVETMRPGRTAIQFTLSAGKWDPDRLPTNVVRAKDELNNSLFGSQADIEQLIINRLSKIFEKQPPAKRQPPPHSSTATGGVSAAAAAAAVKKEITRENVAVAAAADDDDDDDDDIFADAGGSYVCELPSSDNEAADEKPSSTTRTIAEMEEAAAAAKAKKAADAAVETAHADVGTNALVSELLTDDEVDKASPVGPAPVPSVGNGDDDHEEFAYPDTDNAYPDTDNAYPDTDNAYPDTDNAYPDTDNAYPDTDNAYPDTDAAFPDDKKKNKESAARQQRLPALSKAAAARAGVGASTAAPASDATRRRKLEQMKRELGLEAGSRSTKPGLAVDDDYGDEYGPASLGLGGGTIGDASDIKALSQHDKLLAKKEKAAKRRQQQLQQEEDALYAVAREDDDDDDPKARKKQKTQQQRDQKFEKEFKKVEKLVQRKFEKK